MIAREMREQSQFQRGVELFNAGKFFEAHEAWEEIWLAESEPEKTFVQGLIQVAAAFHHRQRGNRKGMDSLLEAGLAKLEQFPERHRGIAAGQLCEDANRCAKGRGPLPRIHRIVG
jgi:predicted metal-dependent hydrolase